MSEFRKLDGILPSVSAEDFFARFVSTRTPVVIQGLPDDAAFKARSWTDLSYLESKAGDSRVLIEPLHPDKQQFGTDIERVPVKFREFIGTLKMESGPHPYLTTQYAEQEDDLEALTVLPPPADALADDFPRVPRLMGNLFLQQVNLWLGKSKDGATSGLHHDFHDNLYCLLLGKKRFVLYPPKEIEHLYPFGKLDVLHPNGLISYVDAPVRADGLPFALALKARVKALEAKLDAMPTGKGKSRQNTTERQALLDEYEAAIDELANHALEGTKGVELDDVEDDFDKLMGRMDDAEFEDGFPNIGADGGEENGEDEDSEDENEEGGFPFGKDEEHTEDGGDGNAEPSSFSRIPTAFVHQHLKLLTTAVPPSGVVPRDFPNFTKTPAPFVVELKAGEMLYLPASWWHEVTSSSTGNGDDAVHMAFNYWFYPPDKLDRFEEPYEDVLVWEYFRAKSAGAERGESVTNVSGKRKAPGDATQTSKKSRR